jgi:hypothetical protein
VTSKPSDHTNLVKVEEDKEKRQSVFKCLDCGKLLSAGFPLPNSSVYETEELGELVGYHMAQCKLGQEKYLFKEEFMKTCD